MKALIALIPSAGVLFLFYLAVKAMLEGDRRERAAYARWEQEQDAAAAADGIVGPGAEISGADSEKNQESDRPRN